MNFPLVLTDPSIPSLGHAGWRRWLRRLRASTLLTLISLIGGCWQGEGSRSTAIALSTPGDEALWEELHPGLERRILQPLPSSFVSFIALRIDPLRFRFRVHYRPGEARFLNDWSAQLPDALVIVNGNFFDPQNTALGLIVSDGIVYGSAYVGMGGLFEVRQNTVRVRSTIAEPVRADEVFEQAVQGFPVLISDRRVAFTQTQTDRPSRRTVIAQDGSGRILLIVSASLIGMTLADLAHWLAQTDLDLVTAVNLDGGGSTLLLARADAASVAIPSFDRIPAVLAVYPR
ncbi:MAG: phosphodiester glycosidase family protein [Anaerolinea sp.]|nr:phosphodiester glycosidase family protein [Anaerolinea sp.]